MGFHFVSNRHTFSRIFELDMSSPAAIAERRELAVDIIVSWCTYGKLPPA